MRLHASLKALKRESESSPLDIDWSHCLAGGELRIYLVHQCCKQIHFLRDHRFSESRLGWRATSNFDIVSTISD